MSHRRYLSVLMVLFSIIWFALAIEPLHRQDWLLENVLVVVGIALLILSYFRFPLSRISYSLVFIFLCLHTLGAHYTYSEVPYDRWYGMLTGESLSEVMGWQRNHFDRVVHFCYGLLLAYPVRELFLRIADARGFWGYFLPLDLTMSTSMIYELIEWVAAELFGGELGMAFLGAQGDIWDAHKDMALASLGGLIAMLITALLNIYLQKDFSREWAKSLKVKNNIPLGEDEIVRMWKNRD